MFSTIREATVDDLPALQRLIRSAADPDEDLIASAERHVLVLDTGDELGGLAIVKLEPPHAHLEALVMAPRYCGRTAERRLLGVARALCEAFGCIDLDVRKRIA